MSIRDLILKNRTYRRFHQDHVIGIEILKELVELARFSASAANKQPLKYILSATPEKNALIFPCLGWAGYLKYWPGPEQGERPSAYIVVLGDTKISKTFGFDVGIAVENVLLGATEKGLGGCVVATIEQERLRKGLKIPKSLEILLVLALGKPKEEVIMETVGEGGDIRYWRDEEGRHHVPKRPLDEIIID